MSQATGHGYVMGHTDRERRRLALQASILNPFTEELFRRAGIAAGMRVLDLGCGVGEVSMVAARLVGRGGEVVGVDLDEGALAMAADRAREEGFPNVRFVKSGVTEYCVDSPFHAVVGRHILIHAREPGSFVGAALDALYPGGVAAFQEYDMSVPQRAYPDAPLRDRVFSMFQEFFCTVTHGNIGMRLYHLMVEAGFGKPVCWAEFPMDGGADSPFYEWVAETFRTVQPRIEAMGMFRGEPIDVDTLADKLCEEAVSLGSCFPAPQMVSCFARKP